MLSRHELARVAADYGAAENQIRRDHLISHVLHALAELDVPSSSSAAQRWPAPT